MHETHSVAPPVHSSLLKVATILQRIGNGVKKTISHFAPRAQMEARTARRTGRGGRSHGFARPLGTGTLTG